MCQSVFKRAFRLAITAVYPTRRSLQIINFFVSDAVLGLLVFYCTCNSQSRSQITFSFDSILLSPYTDHLTILQSTTLSNFSVYLTEFRVDSLYNALSRSYFIRQRVINEKLAEIIEMGMEDGYL